MKKIIISLFSLIGLLFQFTSLEAQQACQTVSGIPGCAECAACEASVCAIDAFCCDIAWDGICVNEAAVDSNCTYAPGGPCAAMPAVPTMGEWGLIILALLTLSFGTVFMMRRSMAVEGVGNVSVSSGIPFNRGAYGKMLAGVMAGLAVIFAIAVFVFGYEMTNADLPGSLIAGPILAYLLHLLASSKKEQ